MAAGLLIRGAAAFAARLAGAVRAARPAASAAAEAGAEAIRQTLVNDELAGRSVRRGTGELAASWSVRTDKSAGSATLSSDAPHARALEYGFRGVVPVRSKKGRVFSRRMNVPERRPLRNAIEKSRDRRLEAMATEFRRRLFAG